MAQLFLLDTPVSELERERLETQAHERGYKTVGDLLALAKADASVISSQEDDAVDVASPLREALKDVKSGRVYPYDKLREMIACN